MSLTLNPEHTTLETPCAVVTFAGPFALALLFVCAPAAAAADDVTLLRVFLKDGTVLVSYGEPARVDDRVIFSMPTAATPNPPLHLVNLASSAVDWERTTRYAEAVRAAHYIETQAASDYAALSGRMTQALNQLTETEDAGRRLAIAENARRMLAAWPQEHYNYRLNEVRQMLSLLDEAIADLRAATGDGKVRPEPHRIYRATAARGARSTADAERDDRTGVDRGPARRHRDRATGASRDCADSPRSRPAALPADWLDDDARRHQGAVRERASRGSRLSVVDCPHHRSGRSPRQGGRRSRPRAARRFGARSATGRLAASGPKPSSR